MTVKASKRKKTAKGSHHHMPDHTPLIKRLNKISGQINGVKKMIEDNRYCPDILMQTRAARSAIKSLESVVLESHLKHCVHGAINSHDEKESSRKIEELISIFKKDL